MIACRDFTIAVVATAMLAPLDALAQFPSPQLAQRAVEVGYGEEWFHRDFDTTLLSDSEWSIGSIVINYGAFDWLTLHAQGGVFSFDHEDFPNAQYRRYTLGIGGTARLHQSGPWSFSFSARYVDTFDRDYAAEGFHKGIDSWSAALVARRAFDVWRQDLTLWAGPLVSDDRTDAYLWDSREPIEADAGVGWGASGGVRIVLHDVVSLFGYASYIDYATGGVGIALHAGKGSF